MNDLEVPAAFRVWMCGRCQRELVTMDNCPCCVPELACLNCWARFDGLTGDFLRIGGAS